MKLRTCISSLAVAGSALFFALPALAGSSTKQVTKAATTTKTANFTIYNNGGGGTSAALNGIDVALALVSQGQGCVQNYNPEASIEALGTLTFSVTYDPNSTPQFCILTTEKGGSFAGQQYMWGPINFAHAFKTNTNEVELKYEWGTSGDWSGILFFHYNNYNNDSTTRGYGSMLPPVRYQTSYTNAGGSSETDKHDKCVECASNWSDNTPIIRAYAKYCSMQFPTGESGWGPCK